MIIRALIRQIKVFKSKVGQHSTVVAFVLLNPHSPILNHSVSKFLSQKIFLWEKFDVAVLKDSELCLELGQCKKLNKVDQTHPVLGRGTLY